MRDVTFGEDAGHAAQGNTAQPRRSTPVFPGLSERERDILALLAQGYKNADVAARLVLSPKTVRNDVSNSISKLQVADRAHTILRAKAEGSGGC